MGSYADSLLAVGERIVLRERRHWLAILLDSRWAILALIVAAVVAIVDVDGVRSSPDGPIGQVLGFVILALVVFGIAWIVWTLWNWYNEDYLVTNRRVIHVEGVLNKHTSDSSLEKINDAQLDQHFVGRIFGYGDLDILTAADGQADRFKMLNRVVAFKREMLNQKNELEFEQMRPPVTPPLRAGTSSGANPPPPPPPMPAPTHPTPMSATGDMLADAGESGSNGSGSAVRTAPPPVERRMAPADVTATLASLADLRDRGAITPEEYEAKKSELLSLL